MHRVQQAERLDLALAQVALVALERRAAANIDVPQVKGRMPVDDPVRQYLARSTGGLDTDRIEASPHGQPALFRRLAKEISVGGSEALRPVEDPRPAGRLESGPPPHGTRKQRLDVA